MFGIGKMRMIEPFRRQPEIQKQTFVTDLARELSTNAFLSCMSLSHARALHACRTRETYKEVGFIDCGSDAGCGLHRVSGLVEARITTNMN
jgi:hypothetical protein